MIVSTDVSEGINRDDLIVFKREERSFVKRVVGVSGDQIKVNKKGIYINNKLYKEALNIGFSEINISIKDNQYFVLGDNVNNSEDSRYFGPVEDEQVIGKVIRIFHMSSR